MEISSELEQSIAAEEGHGAEHGAERALQFTCAAVLLPFSGVGSSVQTKQSEEAAAQRGSRPANAVYVKQLSVDGIRVKVFAHHGDERDESGSMKK